MASPESVTQWLDALQAGDAAGHELWQRYIARLVGLACQRLAATRIRAVDAGDVALVAFDRFCRGAAQGRFPRLAGRHNLWSVLVTITERRATKLIQKETSQKAGTGRVHAASE